MKQVDKQIKMKGKSFKPLNDTPEWRKQVEQQEDQPFCRLKSLQVGLHFEAPCSLNVFLPVPPCQRTLPIPHAYFVFLIIICRALQLNANPAVHLSSSRYTTQHTFVWFLSGAGFLGLGWTHWYQLK